MELALLVYAISLLPAVDHALTVVAVVVAAATVMGIVINVDDLSRIKGKFVLAEQSFALRFYVKMLWIAIPILLISQSIKVLLPSEKTAYMMIGAYTAQRVAENPKVQDMSGKVIKIIDSKLDDYVAAAEKEISKKLTDQKQ